MPSERMEFKRTWMSISLSSADCSTTLKCASGLRNILSYITMDKSTTQLLEEVDKICTTFLVETKLFQCKKQAKAMQLQHQFSHVLQQLLKNQEPVHLDQQAQARLEVPKTLMPNCWRNKLLNFQTIIKSWIRNVSFISAN
jgi:hypothetical protein